MNGPDDTADSAATASAAGRRRWWPRRSTPTTPKIPEPLDVVEHHRRGDHIRERLWQNLTPLVTSVVFAFVIVKVLLIARGNPGTALTLVSRAGPGQVIGGVLVLTFPLIGTALANIAAYVANDTTTLDRYERRKFWFYYVGLVFWLSFVVPWFTTTMLLLLTAFYLWTAGRRHQRNEQRAEPGLTVDELLTRHPDDVVLRNLIEDIRRCHRAVANARAAEPLDEVELTHAKGELAKYISKYNARVDEVRAAARPRVDAVAAGLLVTSFLPLLGYAITDRPWVPAERLTVGRETFTGFVIESGSDWTYILLNDSRLVRIVRTGSVSERVQCATAGETGSEQRTIWRAFAKVRARYPKCDDLARDISPAVPGATPSPPTQSATPVSPSPTTPPHTGTPTSTVVPAPKISPAPVP